MANKLNQILCATGAGANTGVGDCPYQMGPFLGGFITPRNFRIPKATAEDPALLQTFLKNATMAPIGQRIYPIHGFVGMPADNSADDTTETFGYGRPIR
ncbi:MAG TPA: hypothetical protein VHA52_08730, partial [Candidatus Babeliaceae bacterium]|nr:hypothetical protein [Candidatus Babeliaceae bacterium]